MDLTTGVIGALITLLSAPVVVKGWQWWLKRLEARRTAEEKDRERLHQEIGGLRQQLTAANVRITELTAESARMGAQLEAMKQDLEHLSRIEVERDGLREEVNRLTRRLWQHGIDPKGSDPRPPPKDAGAGQMPD